LIDAEKMLEEVQSTESKTSQEKGDVYLASTSTQSDRESWLIDYGVSYHMTPHIEWFFEYERFDGHEVLLRDDSPTGIVGKVKFD